MPIPITTILQLLILFQATFFAIFLLISSQGKKISNRLLASLLLLVAAQMVIFIATTFLNKNLAVNVNCSFGFAYGPILYLYTKSLIFKKNRLNKIDILHFLPFVLLICLAFTNIKVCDSHILYLYIISILIYIVFSSIEITRYRVVLRQTQSDFDRQNLSWLKLMLTIAIIVFTADFIQFLSNLLSKNSQLHVIFEILVLVLLLFLISTMVFKGLIQPEIFLGINKEDHEFIKQKISRYASSTLTKDQSKRSKIQLENYMWDHKPFLEASLSLNDLAIALKIKPRHLSQIINQEMQQNFLEYINSKRIEEAIRLIKQSEDHKQTVQEVMYTVGFNSKSAFHYAFKKKTGLTPTQFKNKV